MHVHTSDTSTYKCAECGIGVHKIVNIAGVQLCRVCLHTASIKLSEARKELWKKEK